jgi:hypothetical protein
MENIEKFEQALIAQLIEPSLDKTTLKRYSSVLAQLQNQKLSIERIWKIGMPYPDTLMVQGRLGVNDFVNLYKVFEIPRIQGLEIFPLGIINPEFLEFRLKIDQKAGAIK